MRVKKNIEIGIDIYDPINVYADSDVILHIVADRYENRCYRGCFILKVNKILRMGECVIAQNGGDSYGTIPIIIEVDAIVYAVGEIINGCVVNNKDKMNMIVCASQHANIILMSSTLMNAITTNHIISVRVVNVKYVHGEDKVSVSAIPFMFAPKPLIFKVGEYDNETVELIADVVSRIESEEEKMAVLKKKSAAWKTFDTLLYAYAKPQKAPVGAKEYRLHDIVKTKKFPALYLSRDSRINLSTDVVYGYDKMPAITAIVREDIAPANVMIALLEDYCGHMRMIREMIEIYSTEKIIANHRVLWQIYKKNKL